MTGTRIVEFLTAATTWSGSGSIPVRLWEHVWISLLTVLIAAVLTIPPGLLLAHRRKGTLVASSLVNIGRAVPSFGILAVSVVLLIGVVGISPLLVFPALIALAGPPMFTNAITGVVTVPPETVEAARGMGMRDGQILWRVELPLALPVITEGVRVAVVQVIATATLAALVAGPGLGRYIVDGFAKQRGEGELVVGAVLVAMLAVAAEAGFGYLERAVTPPGVAQR
jgi:osmoprotectant transport system permease protein